MSRRNRRGVEEKKLRRKKEVLDCLAATENKTPTKKLGYLIHFFLVLN